ncbi:hypothetical protein AB4876_17845 [Zhongshania guokunii]|uniref:Uncharacterized protein n=1 Tax=Zhongshania guokunii TaxID=641783 RepID=A0ABV3UA09_9GAMM
MDNTVIQDYVKTFKRYRTPVLAVLATLMLVSSAVWTFDVPWQDIASYFLLCVVGVGVVALLSAALVFALKRLRG